MHSKDSNQDLTYELTRRAEHQLRGLAGTRPGRFTDEQLDRMERLIGKKLTEPVRQLEMAMRESDLSC